MKFFNSILLTLLIQFVFSNLITVDYTNFNLTPEIPKQKQIFKNWKQINENEDKEKQEESEEKPHELPKSPYRGYYVL